MVYDDTLDILLGKIKKEIVVPIDSLHNIVIFDKSNSKFMHDFLTMPYYLKSYYTDFPKKVFPIYQSDKSELKNKRKGKNPFFDDATARYFLIRANDIPIARALAFNDKRYDLEKNTFREKHYGYNVKTGWIGFFEAIPSQEIASFLLNCCENYLKKCFDVDLIIANAEFNGNGRMGVLSSGFEHTPYILEGYNPDYYNRFFENAGYFIRNFENNSAKSLEEPLRSENKFDDKWYSFVVSNDSNGKNIKQRLERILEISNKKFNNSEENEVIARRVNFNSIDSDVEKLIGFYNRIWSVGNHPHYRKMTPKEMNTLKNDLLLVCSEYLTVLLEKNDENFTPSMIGALIGVYDINETIREIDEPFMRKVGLLFSKEKTSEAISLIKEYTQKNNLFYRDLQIIRRHMDKLRNNPFVEREERERKKILPLSIKFADFAFPILVKMHDFFGFKDKPPSLSYESTNKQYTRARILIMGVDEAYRKRAYDTKIMAELFNNTKERLKTINEVSGSLVAEVNLDMARALRKLGSEALCYNVYTKKV